MAESNRVSWKRMRFSSSSASEILTTSKSHNQRDRSVRFAATVSHTGNGFRVHQSPSLGGKIDSRFTRTYPRVTIKDLRLRRVFAPSSLSSDWECRAKGDNRTKEQDEESRISNFTKEGIKTNAGGLKNAEGEELLQTTPPDHESLISESLSLVNEAERVYEEITEPAVKKSGINLCSKSVLHPCSRAKIFKNPGSISYKRLLPYLMQAADDRTSSGRCSKPEKLFNQNLPDIKLSCDNGVSGETVEDPKEEVSELMLAKSQPSETTKPVLQSVDRVFNKQSTLSLCGNNSTLKKVIASSPNKKSACSRRKLFKTPGSVNYRRMLPYLRATQEDNPCVPEKVYHRDHQKNTEENNLSSMLPSENEVAQEVVPSNVIRESDICFTENNEPFPCEHVSVSQEWSDPDKEQETQVKHVILDTKKNVETPDDVLCSEVPLSPPLVGLSSSSEVTLALNNLFVKKLVGEENMNFSEKAEANNSAEKLEADSSILTTELVDPSVVVGTPPSISPSKGILKRNIRGCRGMCSCLNCSSFRLNAERAFEFSRNQLQDTEVMVLDLVREISHLKNMLEKYDSADHSETYKSQAGEAAERAFEVAELARSRLHQMNDDLQVHCRIPNEQRARVKFAHYVHEKTILKASEPRSP